MALRFRALRQGGLRLGGVCLERLDWGVNVKFDGGHQRNQFACQGDPDNEEGNCDTSLIVFWFGNDFLSKKFKCIHPCNKEVGHNFAQAINDSSPGIA